MLCYCCTNILTAQKVSSDTDYSRYVHGKLNKIYDDDDDDDTESETPTGSHLASSTDDSVDGLLEKVSCEFVLSELCA